MTKQEFIIECTMRCLQGMLASGGRYDIDRSEYKLAHSIAIKTAELIFNTKENNE